MQLGIRLHDTRPLSFEERIGEVHRMGFTCGYLALWKVLEDLSAADEALTPGLAMHIRNVCAGNQVDIAVLGSRLNLADPDKRRVETAIHQYMSHIRFASWLGCGLAEIENGSDGQDSAFTPEWHTEEALKLFISNVRSVVKYAKKMGVVVGLRPAYRHIVWNSQRARRVLDEINSPNLQIIFDPVALLDIPNYTERKAVFEEAIDLLGPDIGAVNLKDFVVREGRLVSMGCGRGEMDYAPILKFMKERKPYIHAILENTTPETGQQAKSYIQRLYNQV